MPQVDVPNQFGDPTLTPEEAAAACGPAAAVAFARANGRNPTLREALDLAKQVGWTAAGGMNGVQNQKRLLDRMGIPSELDTSASPDAIRRRVQAGQDVTVSTPVHYYVVDGVDERGRVHVGQSGLARRGGAEWMTLEDIASRDGGINGALYQTAATTGGDGVDTNGDRPPSEFEPPSRAGSSGSSGPVTRGDRMRARVADLRQQRTAKQAQVDALLKPRPEEAPKADDFGDVTPAEKARAEAARQDRMTELSLRRAELSDLDKAISSLETDAANDPDPKPAASETRAPSTVSTSANEPYIVTRMPDGSLKREPNPNYVAPKPGASRAVSASSNEPYIVRETPDGKIVTEPNPNYRPDRPKTTTHVVGGRLVVVDENGNVSGSTDLRTPEEVRKGQIDLQKTEQDLLPKQQQILQSHLDTVKYLQGMVERGEMDPGQADAYVQLSKQATESALKGYTPFQEMTERRQAEQARQKMGVDLLNQRLSSGGALASSLLSSASSLAGHAMLRPGQTSLGVDPLANLMPLLAELQGGADVPALAKGMLAGGQAPPAPAGPIPAGL